LGWGKKGGYTMGVRWGTIGVTRGVEAKKKKDVKKGGKAKQKGGTVRKTQQKVVLLGERGGGGGRIHKEGKGERGDYGKNFFFLTNKGKVR